MTGAKLRSARTGLAAAALAAAAQHGSLNRIATKNKAVSETQRKREMSTTHTAHELARIALRDPYANMDSNTAAWNREIDAKKRIKEKVKLEKEAAKRSELKLPKE